MVNNFQVIVAYVPVRTGECPLHEVDEVDIIKNVGDGLVLGRNVTSGTSGVFPENCIDRNSNISGAIVNKVTKKPKPLKLEKPPKVLLLTRKPPNVDTKQDKMHGRVMQSEDPIDVREGLEQTTGASGVFPEKCIDRNASISGANVRKVTKKPKPLKLEKPPNVLLLSRKPPNMDTMQDRMNEIVMQSDHPIDVREELEQTTNVVKEKFPDMKYRCCKALFRIFGAIIACVSLYPLLYFSFGYGLMNSVYIALAVLPIFVVGFVSSALLRCTCLIMVPNFCTKKGRTIFLAIITGLLLSGPVMNISQNTKEVATSLGECHC